MKPSKPKPIQPGNYNGIIVSQAYHHLIDIIQPLDFFCVAGDSFVSKSICYVTKNLSPDRTSEYNHCGIFPDGSLCTLEALWTLTSNNFISRYEGKKVLIARWSNITPKATLHALKETNKHIGQWYPALRLVLHLANIAHIFHWTTDLVCSEYVAKVLYKAGARHGEFYGTTPDILADEIHNQLNKDRTGPKYAILYEAKLPSLFYRYCEDCKTYWYVSPMQQLRCPKCNQSYSVIGSDNYELELKINRFNEDKRYYIHEHNKH